MRKTPQEFRRNNVKALFSKVLQAQVITLKPLDITVRESFNDDFTKVDISFSETVGGVNRCIDATATQARGFVDGLFKACHEHYSETYTSLQNIKLVNYQARPNLKRTQKTIGSEAKVEVGVVVEVKNHGIAEFHNQSRSILHSSFVNILSAFEFYINCERSFDKIQIILEDAKNRSRGDIVQSCMYDLSKLTEVNTYEKREKY